MRRLLHAARSSGLLPLAIIVMSYTAIISYLSLLRYNNFFTSDWDFGTMQQMLWSTLHGRLLFETGDYSTGGYLSYLEINSAYIAIPVAFLYSLYQSPATLFVIQSFAVALSSFPLYFIVLRTGHGRQAAFAFVLLFLFGMGTLSSVFYDFHWESFIPFEFFSFYLLFSAQRYRYAAATLLVGSATLEVFPFLAAAAVVYFAVSGPEIPHEAGFPQGRKLYIIFIAACAVCFIFTVAMQRLLTDVVIGTAAGRAGMDAYSLFIHPVLLPGILFASSAYWLLLFASVAFLPLLARRSLVMSLPWFVESVFVYPKFSIAFGYQYAFIALPPLMVSAVLGAKRLRGDERISTIFIPLIIVLSSLSLLLSGASAVFLRQNGYVLSLPVLAALLLIFVFHFRKELKGDGRSPGIMPAPDHRRMFIAILLSLLFFNIVMGPLNTSNYGVNSGYYLSYSTNPSFHYIDEVAGMVKSGSTILASDNLFPLVDASLRSYSVLWLPFSPRLMPHFPFSPANLPEYVFADTSQLTLMPSFIVSSIFNGSIYGLVAYVYYSGYPGTVYLFRLGYTGHATAFMASSFNSSVYLNYHNLRTGLSGHTEKFAGSAFGKVIASRNGNALDPSDSNRLNIWYGPYMTLLPGNYTVTFSIMIQPANGNASIPVTYMNSNSFGSPYYYSVNLSASSVGAGLFGRISFGFRCTEPAPLVEFRGYLLLAGNLPAGIVRLNYIHLQRN